MNKRLTKPDFCNTILPYFENNRRYIMNKQHLINQGAFESEMLFLEDRKRKVILKKDKNNTFAVFVESTVFEGDYTFIGYGCIYEENYCFLGW